MVKISRIIIIFLFLFFILFLNTCIFIVDASDIDERMLERNNFVFLSDDDRYPVFGDDYSFIVLTDIHIEDGNTRGFENLQTAIDNNDNVKFVTVLGDITNRGSESDLLKFIEIAKSLTVPCYPVIGNHDIPFGSWKNWSKHIGSSCYRIEADTATLFILDSANIFFGKEQLDWLERELISTKESVFVFTHSRFFTSGNVNPIQLTDTRERARIVSILKGKANMVFMGHAHIRDYNKAGGVEYISIEDFKSNSVYCLVTVSGGNISHEFKKL